MTTRGRFGGASKVSMAAAIAAGLLIAADARSQSATDKAAAEALFEEGRKLMAEGKAEQACPKFASSQKLDPGLGTLLNLGNCYEKIGKTASAWAQFREAASLGAATGDPRRAEVAQQRAAALEPRLSRLTIIAPSPPPPGLSVVRDGTTIDIALLGTALPIDPGTHLIEATAPGKTPWRAEIKVEGEKSNVRATIPPLQAAAPPDTSASAQVAPPPSASVVIPSESDAGVAPSTWTNQHTFAVVAGSVGVVGLAVGGILGLSARSKWNDAQDACPGGHCTTQDDVDLGNSARSTANVATILLGVGVVGIGTGAVLWLTAPKQQEQPAPSSSVSLAPALGKDMAGLWLRGGF